MNSHLASVGRTADSWCRVSLMAVLCVLSLCSHNIVAKGQGITGTISGRITDQSGAAMPGMPVAVTNLANNTSVTYETNESGEYRASLLSIGTYRVTVAKQGFKTVAQSEIRVSAGQSVRVDLEITVGAVTETIEVRGVTSLLQTDSSQVSNSIESRRVRELPVAGRDLLRLATLGPGTIQRQTSSIHFLSNSYLGSNIPTIAGGRGESTSFTYGGINTNNRKLNYPIEKPSLDAIEEFSVLANNYTAEYGQGDGQVIVEFRSGGNKFHGSVYEYLQNDALNARGYFDVKKPLQRYNQFGGAVGGPIYTNRAFFFASYEGTRNPSSETQGGLFPTADLLRGDFSNFRDAQGNIIPIFDPESTDPVTGLRRQFQGNIIPSSRINPIATKLYNLYQAPVGATIAPGASNNVIATVPRKFTVDQTSVKIDYHLKSVDVFSTRYSFSDPRTFAGNITAAAENTTSYRNQVIGQTWTHSFGPTLINEFRAGYVRQRDVNLPPIAADQNLQQQAGITKPLPYNFIPGIFFQSSTGTPTFNQTNPIVAGGGGEVQQTFQFIDNLSWSRGSHGLKFGLDVRRRRWDTIGQLPAGGGSLRTVGLFSSQLRPDSSTPGNFLPLLGTGSPIADFLLGQLTGVDFGVGLNIFSYRDTELGLFAQDTWRLTPKLTLMLGLRWDYQSPISEKNGRQSWFVSDERCPNGCLLNEGKFGGTRDAIVNPFPGEEKIRPGGVYPDYNNFGPRVSVAYNLKSNTVIRGGFGIFYSIYGQNNFAGATNPPFGSGYQINSAINNDSNPLNRLLGSTYTLSNIYPPTQPVGQTTPGTLALNFFYDINNVQPRLINATAAIQHAFTPTLSAEIGYLGKFGRNLSNFTSINPCTTSPCSRDPLTNVQIRRFRNFASIAVIKTVGENDYNAGYIKVDKRFSKGFSLNASWTWSRNITTGGDSEGNDIFLGSAGGTFSQDALTRHLSVLDATHRFVINGIYELPFGRDKRFGSNASGFVNQVISGWQVSWITSFQSGTALDLSSFNALRFKPGQSQNLKRLDFRETGLFFDPNLFQATALGGEIIPYTHFRGAGINNWDISVFKSFRLFENHQLQFRADMFNIWNHAQFETPGHVNTFPGFGTFQARNPGFFEFGARPPRNIQLALRYIF